MTVDVYLEVGNKRVFAAAVDWPGWCRSAANEKDALEALLAYRLRYLPVARRARLRLPSTDVSSLVVVERVAGSATTDFGAPGSVPAVDHGAVGRRTLVRAASVVEACWAELDGVIQNAPAVLLKGPRGGGRDRDEIVAHVLAAECAYARKVGVGHEEPDASRPATVRSFRRALADRLRDPSPVENAGPRAKPWPLPYCARRVAWHVLDHAWEIEDKSGPG